MPPIRSPGGSSFPTRSTGFSTEYPPLHTFRLQAPVRCDSLGFMGEGSRITGLIRRSAMPALALIVVGTFAGHAVAGPNGVLAWGGYHRALKERQAELAELDRERAKLELHSRLLDPDKADPDMADELVRKDLGLVRPDEVIIPLE